MSLIGTALIAGGISALGNLGASYFAGKEAKKAAGELDKQQRNLDNWYDITNHRDYTRTAEAQSAITAARELMQSRYLAGRGAAAVSGASAAEEARMKESANDMVAKTIDSIAARGTATKQAADSTYLAGLQNVSEKRADLHNRKAANIQKAGESLSNAAVGVATGLFGAEG